ncbi:MAG: hypothetical protein A2776_02525 [Candidatus Levybacteria bacterium RIFCSPHIGHO2_01_FULL_40_10]|nr:MAG: hypothetical protein A2776_02525 [Candidatus Levybacteria bacterium RIFCSPHIGHO2_01_FULL_40_10]
MEDFTKHKTQIEKEVVERVATGIEKGDLKEEDLPLIGRFVLEKLDLARNQGELVSFLSELSARWPIFLTIEKIEEGSLTIAEESEVANGVLTLLKHGKIDDALSLAKNQTK